MRYYWLILSLLASSVLGQTRMELGCTSTLASETDLVNKSMGLQWVADSTGTLDSGYAYVDVTSGPHNFKIAVYDFSTSDSDLVDSTYIASVSNGDNQWIQIAFVNGGEITEGNKYGIVAMCDGSAVEMHFATSSSTCLDYNDATSWAYDFSHVYSAWPATKEDYTFAAAYDVSIYAVYNTAAPPSTGPPNYRHGEGGKGLRHSLDGKSVRHDNSP